MLFTSTLASLLRAFRDSLACPSVSSFFLQHHLLAARGVWLPLVLFTSFVVSLLTKSICILLHILLLIIKSMLKEVVGCHFLVAVACQECLDCTLTAESKVLQLNMDMVLKKSATVVYMFFRVRTLETLKKTVINRLLTRWMASCSS